jgi:hypothetical protein
MAEIMEIEVLRYRPEEDNEPWTQRYQVPFTHEMSVLEALTHIKDHIDSTLSYRWSCRMAICGSCGMMVNGKPKLGCKTFLRDYISEGKIHRLCQRNIGLPSGYRRYYGMAGKKLQLPYRAIGTRYIASPGFRRASSPSLKISAKDDLHESICAKKFIGRFVQTN